MLKQRIDKMGDVIMHLDSNVKFYRNEFELYVKQYGGRHLTKEEWEKLELMLEWMRKNPDTDNAEDTD